MSITLAEEKGLEPPCPFRRLLSTQVQYHYATLPCLDLAPRDRVELPLDESKSSVLPLNERGICSNYIRFTICMVYIIDLLSQSVGIIVEDICERGVGMRTSIYSCILFTKVGKSYVYIIKPLFKASTCKDLNCLLELTFSFQVRPNILRALDR